MLWQDASGDFNLDSDLPAGQQLPLDLCRDFLGLAMRQLQTEQLGRSTPSAHYVLCQEVACQPQYQAASDAGSDLQQASARKHHKEHRYFAAMGSGVGKGSAQVRFSPAGSDGDVGAVLRFSSSASSIPT